MTTDFDQKLRVKKISESILKNGKSKAAIVKEFTKAKAIDYPVEQELFTRILALVHEYDGEISFSSCIGVMDLAKNELLNHKS